MPKAVLKLALVTLYIFGVRAIDVVDGVGGGRVGTARSKVAWPPFCTVNVLPEASAKLLAGFSTWSTPPSIVTFPLAFSVPVVVALPTDDRARLVDRE